MNQAAADAKSIFLRALDRQTPEELASFLEAACQGAEELRARVSELLDAHRAAGNFLHGGGSGETNAFELIAERPGTVIGPYKLLQQIGEGGMGVVFMAEQTDPIQRTVALKIIKPGMDTRQVIVRFETERQAVALMDHPNIAKVLDAGTTDSGRPYFVMELVKGVAITRYCDEKHLPLRERLELFVQVCQAVQHAHQKGIIHRDIKPNNVLVAEYDNRAVPKVIDFGVAKATAQKLTERTMFTEFGQVLGTMEYMSPEQSKFNQLDIDTRSDIYSLGVLLYELLAGSTPFERKRLHAAAFDEMLRIIREEEPPKPSTRLSSLTSRERLIDSLPLAGRVGEGVPTTLASIAANRHTEPARLSKDVQGELDWIVMKALEKDRARRYESAASFAADVERHLRDEPVQAGPPSAVYRFRKFAKRNRMPLAAGALLTLAMLVALGGITSGIWERRARQARVTGQLEVILDEVARFEQEQKWHEALLVAKRAEPALAAGEATPKIQQRARQALADLEFVRRLEETRAESGTVWGTRDRTSIPLAARADQEYSDAFREAGIDVDTLPVKETVELISARGQIAAAVLPALDDWVAVRSTLKNETGTRRLIDVQRTADPDSWRQQVRECLARKDWLALETLARSPDLERQPAATISFLCAALRKQAESDIERPGGEDTELGPRGFFLETDILRRAQRRFPADYWINRRLGINLIWMQSPDVVREGIGYMRAAVALRPQEADGVINLGKGFEYLGEYDQVKACYRKALELAPQDASMHNEVAWVLATSSDATLRDFDEAVTIAERAAELAPQDGIIWNTLGVAQYRAGDLSAAVESLQKSMDLRDGGDSFDWFFLAMARWQLGQNDEAHKCYNKAVQWMDENQPGNEELRVFRAEAEELLKIADEGKATKAVDGRRNSETFIELGRLRVRQGKFPDAAINFTRVIELEPTREYAWFQGGSLLAHLGREEAFRQHCAAMLERFGDTQDRSVAERIVKLMSCVPSEFSGVDAKRIVALADKAIASLPSHQDIDMQWFHLAKGMADYRAGQFESALLSMEKAKTPHWPVRTVLADLYKAMSEFRLGNREASIKTFDSAAAIMMTLPQPGRDNLGEHFHDYLFCQLALREAEALILQPQPKPTTGGAATAPPPTQ